jgi:hypothetical protein
MALYIYDPPTGKFEHLEVPPTVRRPRLSGKRETYVQFSITEAQKYQIWMILYRINVELATGYQRAFLSHSDVGRECMGMALASCKAREGVSPS